MADMPRRISNAAYPFIVLFTFVLSSVGAMCIAEENNDFLSDIDQLVTLGEKAPTTLIESIQSRIEKNPSMASSLLLPKLSDSATNENQLAIYIWAIGLTQDTNSVGRIISIAEITTLDLVKGNCLQALALIGGKQSEDFLMTTLEKTKGKENRFDILNLLAQMQYEPALVKTEEVLKQDFKQYYWQSIFIFGKMGDKSVPFLIKRVNDPDINVRAHAINALGQWLIEPQAADAIRKRYWTENKTEIREMILSSMERISSDSNEIEKFFAEVVAKEKEKELTTFAQETLSNLEEMKTIIKSFKENKRVSPEEFRTEYDKLYTSAGKKGDHHILAQTSTFEDEAKLKRLRERILQRNSDEAFYDYQNINEIIMFNRFISK